MDTAFLLLALGLGYKIFADSSKETKRGLKTLGMIIGIFIMIMSFGGSLCKAWYRVKSSCSSCSLNKDGTKTAEYDQALFEKHHSFMKTGEKTAEGSHSK